ncbi:MAG: DMT family transporter [Planctomycetota bacterium]
MNEHQLGQICALGAAMVWAAALVLFKRSSERISPLALNLFKNAIGLTLLCATLLTLVALGHEQLDSIVGQRPRDIGILMVSGFIGIALADTLFFRALNLVGVGLFTVADCAYAPLAIGFSWWLLDERLGPLHYVGAALVVAGVFTATRHRPPPGRTHLQIMWGMLLAVVAVGMMAFGIVIVKPVLAHCPLLWATTVRMVAGTAPLALLGLASGRQAATWAAFRPSRWWAYAVPAAVLGAYVSTLLWIAGFKFTYATVAAVLNQTSVIFAGVLAAAFLKEEFGWRKILALALAMGGVLLVTFNDALEGAWRQFLAGRGVAG